MGAPLGDSVRLDVMKLLKRWKVFAAAGPGAGALGCVVGIGVGVVDGVGVGA